MADRPGRAISPLPTLASLNLEHPVENVSARSLDPCVASSPCDRVGDEAQARAEANRRRISRVLSPHEYERRWRDAPVDAYFVIASTATAQNWR
jgi:hypothetical protein